MLKHKREDNDRVRFLNQFAPKKTELDYLRVCTDEESRLRAVILKKYPEHMPEFEVALHTGMRPSEQYGLVWSRVDLLRKLITIPKSKNGKTRHIPLKPVVSFLGASPKNPYGFIGRYQAQLLDEETVDEACWKVVKQLASRSSIASDVRDGAIQMFGESNSFNASAANARKLKVLEPFSNRQLE